MDRSERIGLGTATAGHALLIALLALGLGQTRVPPPKSPPAIDVTLADTVALESRSTQAPSPPPQAQAPDLGVPEPAAAPPPPPTPLEPAPRVEQPTPTPPPPKAIAERPAPPKPAPAKRVPAPPQPQKQPVAKPTPAPAKAAPAKPAPARPQRAARLGADFLKGLDDGQPTKSQAPASAAPMGAVAARALNAEINRQIKPFWRPPSGADADQLVTLLSVHLDRSGSVTGEIEVVGQQGVTPSNRAQASLHAERAIQAVKRASPFQNLPPEYYAQWNWLKPLRFDARLAQ